ncbi:hypothetical protein RJ639_009255 [Escallonia herrerae]|uniref:Pentatricopeptide repeat-containing protein-mitochondrial domain-containing protein n=1 Tax=Escallonia herrerae TaxID=1293975 RepID=A0AA88VUH0_9ASTE|nr:hypothetical protein RJ639_009255 [Escallonia herrerae]
MKFLRITRAHYLLNKAIKKLHSVQFPYQLQTPTCPISTKTHSGKTEVVERLVTIFTQNPFYQESQELASVGSDLTTGVVESVLKRFNSWKLALKFFDWASSQHGYKHNCYTYNAMASILSGVRQNAQLKALAVDVVNSRCSMTPGALGFFVRCLGNLGLIDEANVIFDHVRKVGSCVPNSYSYNCLLESISRSGSVELIETRLKEMRDLGWEVDKYTLTPVLQCYCNAGKFGKALGVYNEIQERGWLDSSVFAILAVAFSKWGKVDEAFELVESLESHRIRLNEKTFYVLIHGFVREGRVDRALQLLDKMRLLGFVPDISVYAVLIAGFCNLKEFETALDLYSQLIELNILPDVKLLTVLLSSLPREKDMIRILKENVAREDLDKQSIVLLYNSCLTGLINNGATSKAYSLIQAMLRDDIFNGDTEVNDFLAHGKVVRPDSDSFRLVIDGLCQSSKVDVALGLFRDMDQIGCKRTLLLYNNMISGLSSSNKSEECYELLAEMKLMGFKPTHFTYNSIFGCFCRKMDVAGAIGVVREMHIHGHEPWIKHTTLLVKKLCSSKRAFEASKFLASMVQEGFTPDIVAYSAVIHGFFKIREFDRALKLFRDISARGCCPDVVAYNTVINGLCKVTRLAEAQDIYNEMLENRLVPSVVTYNSLIDAWCKSGEIDRAILCLKRMDEERREPNVITYTTLLDGLCNAGRSDEAVLLWDQMVGKGCSPNNIAFMALIHGLCKCGKPDSALIYLIQMEERQMTPDTFVYVALIAALLSISDAPSAFDILRKMAQNRSFPDSLDKNFTSLRESVCKLSEDARTRSNVMNLISEGSIPNILNISDSGK